MKISLVLIDSKNDKKFFRVYDEEENMKVVFLIEAMKLTNTKVLATFDDKMMQQIATKMIGMEVALDEE